MYFYDSLLLLSNILMLAVHIQSQSLKGPGISSCSYFGSLKKNCGLPDVNIKDIPDACTAIIVNGLYMDLSYNVNEVFEGTISQLDEILQTPNKTVFIMYGHITQTEWTQVLADEYCNGGKNSQDEMKALKSFLDQHTGIKGLLITNLELDKNSVEFPKYSENLKAYLDTMKSNFPDLDIGLFLFAPLIIDQYTNPQLTWLDFTILDPSVDFYVISVVTLNVCTDEFRLLGTAPIGSTNSSSSECLQNITIPDTNYTLSNLRDILTNLSIPKNKIYYRYRIDPLPQDDSISMCNLTISQICLNSTDSSSWCLESIESFNAKGQFAKDNGAGFMVNYIELNDPQNNCKCGSFPMFNAILDGYNGITPIKKCDLLNRS